jgi:hypothetical protein
MKVKVTLIIITFVAVLITGVIFMLLRHARLTFDNIFAKPFRYRECMPEKLLPELESWFDINFPEGIEQIQTSHTLGCWDSSWSHFIVRFSAEPNTVEAFLETFPPKTTIELYTYTPNDDDRSVSAARLRIPDWFLNPIEKGKIAHTPSGQPEVYIDTINKDTFTVYIQGLYPRDSNEIAEKFEKERLKQ